MPDKLVDEVRLRHIIDAIDEVFSFLSDGMEFNDFEQDSLVKSACIYQLGVIGEASNHLSEGLKNRYSNIPWREIIGLRNIIIHKYFGVDEKVVWDVIKLELPDLRSQCQGILNDLD